jgi:hypothetical protein
MGNDMGVAGPMSVTVSNSTYDKVWVCVKADEEYINMIQHDAATEVAKIKALGSRTAESSWVGEKSGYRLLNSGDSLKFDIPQGKVECYVTVFDQDGNFFGGPQCFRATNGVNVYPINYRFPPTFFKVVICPDKTMRKGFKNHTFRCWEGPQEYYGPKFCEGCGKQKCLYPVRDGPSDGYCKLAAK